MAAPACATRSAARRRGTYVDHRKFNLIACIEAGGRWHPDLSNFIKRYIKASCGDDIKTYVYKLKATKQRVSVALRRSTSRAIMEMQRRAKAYPVVAVDAAA